MKHLHMKVFVIQSARQLVSSLMSNLRAVLLLRIAQVVFSLILQKVNV
jgi:hypothetical protein